MRSPAENMAESIRLQAELKRAISQSTANRAARTDPWERYKQAIERQRENARRTPYSAQARRRATLRRCQPRPL